MAIPFLQHNARPLNILLAITAFASLGAALYLQHGLGQDPCPLCIVQRYAWIKLGALFAIAACFPRVRWVFGWSMGFAVMMATVGVAAAIKQLWGLAHPTNVQCGRDALETFLNSLPQAQLFPDVFQSRGFCSDVFPPILGLSLPTWSLIGLSAYLLIALALWVFGMPRKPSRFA